jgi:hypothetical protein
MTYSRTASADRINHFSAVMPALVAGIHVFLPERKQDVDGRDKPGHDSS